MKSILLTVIALFALGASGFLFGQDGLEKHPKRSDVIGVDNEDKEMLAAQEKARETLKQFVDAIQKRKKGVRYVLKVRLVDGEDVEHVWLEPVKWNNPGLIGILAVELVAIKAYKKGDIIKPLPKEISDWMILNGDGSKRGGFTVDLISQRRAKTK